jgi:putative ABC transport system permease protein
MKIYLHLALAYLKKQKGRTAALVLGVALAVMLVFGFDIITESQSRDQLADVYRQYGTYHGIFFNLNQDEIEQIKNDGEVSKSAEAVDLGDAVTDDGISMALNSTDKDYIEMHGYKLKEGRLPAAQGEIALEAQALKKMGLKERLNQTINLKIKKDYVDENGKNQIFMETNSFKLVGITGKPEQYYDNGYYALRGFTYYQEGEENVLPDNLITREEVVKLKSNANLDGKLNQIRERYHVGRLDYEVNNRLITALSEFNAEESNRYNDLIKMMVVITAMLLIYNMFNLSLIDMIKQIGMLRAIRAPKKRVRALIGFQGLVVLIAGLALGLLLGVLFSYCGRGLFNFVSWLDVADASLYISGKSIGKAVLVGTVTVIVSSIIPVWLAGRISPLEAIRTTDRSKGRQKRRAYHKVIRRLSGVTGEMAYQNVWRNKWRTIIIIVAVAMGGVLFIRDIAMLSQQDEFDRATSPQILTMQDNDFKLSFGANTDPDLMGYTAKDVRAISKINGVKNVGTAIYRDGFLESDLKDLQEDFIKYNGINSNNKEVEIPVVIKGYDDQQLEGFKKYIDQGTISLNNSPDGYADVIVFNYYYDVLKDHKTKEIRKDLKLGDIMTIKIPVTREGKLGYEEHEVRVSALLKQEWTFTGDSTMGRYMEIIFPQKNLTAAAGVKAMSRVSVQAKAGREDDVYKEISKILENKPFSVMESKLGYLEEDREGFAQALKSRMVIVALILLIAGLNIFNTIKTSLLIRTNEFAMLRAIGMTVKQMKRMIIKESIIYGVLSSIIAAIAGGYRHYAYYKMANDQLKAAFNIDEVFQAGVPAPVLAVLLYGAIAIIICVFAAYASKNKIEKLNIVEGIKATE